jgi:hypothetical protein
MGNFYTSFTVRGADRDSVLKAMMGRTAAVSPTTSEYTVIWDAESEKQDEKIIDRLGQQLSLTLGSPVFGVLNHDDDILCYWLHSAGRKLDEYNSAPGYFEGDQIPPKGGDAVLLAKTLAPQASHELIERVLRNTDYVFAVERHAALLSTLGMPSFAESMGYRYIDRGELPKDLTKADLTFTV